MSEEFRESLEKLIGAIGPSTHSVEATNAELAGELDADLGDNDLETEKLPVAQSPGTQPKVKLRIKNEGRRFFMLSTAGLIGGAIGATGVAMYKKLPENRVYSTNFSELDPLAYWQVWSSNAKLAIESYENKMSAVPFGPSVFGPNGKVLEGRATADFQFGLPAAFIVRGQDPRNCNLLRITRETKPDRTSFLRVAIEQKRSGQNMRGISIPIRQETLSDRTFVERRKQTLVLEMEGPRVTASLEREPDGPLQQLTQGVPLTAALKRAVGSLDDHLLTKMTSPVRTTLISWTDEVFTGGHFGVWGSNAGPASPNDAFRLFAMKLES